MQRCHQCNEHKSFDKFSKDKSRSLGFNLICKPCDRIKRKKYPTRVGFYYNKFKQEESERHKAYTQTKSGKEAVIRATKKAKEKYLHKFVAREKLRHAVKMGKMIKYPCYCGEIKSQGHHRDYDKPLEVIWLCSTHHSKTHIDMTYLANYYNGV